MGTQSYPDTQPLTLPNPSSPVAVTEHKHAPWGWGWGGGRGEAGGRRAGREERGSTVPDQLGGDKELEFGVEVGETETEGGPVLGRQHRQEGVDRRAVSTTHTHTHTHRHTAREKKRDQNTHTQK